MVQSEGDRGDGRRPVPSAAMAAQGLRSLDERGIMPPAGSTEDHLFQARLPGAMYDWLRAEWFERHVAMTAVVIAAVEAARDATISLDEVLHTTTTSEEGTQRFTVRLARPAYDWVRLEAFRRRIPINRILVASIAAYREWTAGGAGTPGVGDQGTQGWRKRDDLVWH